jgi:hypothetical protein
MRRPRQIDSASTEWSDFSSQPADAAVAPELLFVSCGHRHLFSARDRCQINGDVR